MGNVTRDMGEFLLGFVKGLGQDLGFSDCIQDIDAIYKVVVDMVRFFESGINKSITDHIFRAFKLIAELVAKVADAIIVCVKDALKLVSKFKSLAAALSGNVWDIIKTVVKEGVHIYHDRKELTDDCKAVVADWRAGDFQGSGHAVGDIVGTLLDGLVLLAEPMRELVVV